MSPSSTPMIRNCTHSSAGLRSQVRVFSSAHAVEDGAYVEGDRLVVAHSGTALEVCRLEDIPLLGRHNVANVLAAVAAADAWGVSAAVMRAAIRAFPGVEHRLERVRDAAWGQFLQRLDRHHAYWHPGRPGGDPTAHLAHRRGLR